MKTRALLLVGLAILASFTLVACSSEAADNTKIENTTSDKLKDEGVNIRKEADGSKPAGGQMGGGNATKPSPE